VAACQRCNECYDSAGGGAGHPASDHIGADAEAGCSAEPGVPSYGCYSECPEGVYW